MDGPVSTTGLWWLDRAVGAVGAVAGGVTGSRGRTMGDTHDERRRVALLRRRWPEVAARCVRGVYRPGERAPAIPALVSFTSSPMMLEVVLEPPSSWTVEMVRGFVSALCREWSVFNPVLSVVHGEALTARRVTVRFGRVQLPTTVPEPDGEDRGPGVALGVDGVGGVARLVLGVNGVPHTLVSGASGSGKSTLVRRVGVGYARLGFEVVCIDPKGEGDLDGVGRHPALTGEREVLEALEWLTAVREGRAARKRAGVVAEHGVLVIVDEGQSLLMKGLMPPDVVRLYRGLIQMGRGTGVHCLTAVQQASAQALGGDTFIRENHHARVFLGQGQAEGVRMMLSDRNLTPEHVEQMMFAGPGRAVGSGLRVGDGGAVVVFQAWAPVDRGGRVVVVDDLDDVRSAAPPSITGVDSPGPGDATVDRGDGAGLVERVVGVLPGDGAWVRRVELRDGLGVPDTSLRHALRRAVDEGHVEVRTTGDGRGRRVEVRLAAPAFTP